MRVLGVRRWVVAMLADRKRRARAAARGRRWVGPARRVPARTGGAAMSSIDAGLVVVRSQLALRCMEADLRSGERFEPVVGLSCLEEIDEPVLAPRQVRAIVGDGPRIYCLPGQVSVAALAGVARAAHCADGRWGEGVVAGAAGRA
jgi:hypothetical protein